MGKIADLLLLGYTFAPLVVIATIANHDHLSAWQMTVGISYGSFSTLATIYAYLRYGRRSKRSITGRLLELIVGLLLIVVFLAGSLVMIAINNILERRSATTQSITSTW